MKYKRNLGEKYSPLFFLNAVMAGCLALGSLLFLSWLSPHSTPSILSARALLDIHTETPFACAALLILCGASFLHHAIVFGQLLRWNERHMLYWKQTAAYTHCVNGPMLGVMATRSLTQGIAAHLACAALTVFIPYVFEYSDYLSPLAFLAFGWIMKQTLSLYLHSAIKPAIAPRSNEGAAFVTHPVALFTCMLSLAVAGLGFITIGLFSHTRIVGLVGLIAALFCLIMLFAAGVAQGIPALKRSLTSGAFAEKVLTLTLAGSLLPVVSLLVYRLRLCLIYSFSGATAPLDDALLWLCAFLALLGTFFLTRILFQTKEAFKAALTGQTFSTSSYGLWLLGFALFLTTFYVTNDALPSLSIMERGSVLFWGLQSLPTGLFIALGAQAARFNRKLFAQPRP